MFAFRGLTGKEEIQHSAQAGQACTQMRVPRFQTFARVRPGRAFRCNPGGFQRTGAEDYDDPTWLRQDQVVRFQVKMRQALFAGVLQAQGGLPGIIGRHGCR
jgi:hypothetical protein